MLDLDPWWAILADIFFIPVIIFLKDPNSDVAIEFRFKSMCLLVSFVGL